MYLACVAGKSANGALPDDSATCCLLLADGPSRTISQHLGIGACAPHAIAGHPSGHRKRALPMAAADCCRAMRRIGSPEPPSSPCSRRDHCRDGFPRFAPILREKPPPGENAAYQQVPRPRSWQIGRSVPSGNRTPQVLVARSRRAMINPVGFLIKPYVPSRADQADPALWRQPG